VDPQKLPNPNKPEDAKIPSPDDAGNNISMSEESSVPPGTVVVGGPANPDTDMGPKPPEPVSADPTESQPPVPSPDASQDKDNVAAFMREPSANDVPPAPAGGKKTGLIIGIIIAVIVVLGGAAAAYFAFMKPNPDKVLQTALVNSFSKDKVQSVGFEGDLSIVNTATDTTYSMDFTGAVGQSGQMTLTASVNIPSFTPVSLDMASKDGQTVYLKVAGLADIATLLELDPSVSMYAPLLASIDDQWYKIDPSLLEQFGGSVPTSTGLSDADRQKLADAYTQNPFLKVQETLADETIAGVDSYHYKVGIDSEKFKAFVSAVEAANIESLGLTQPMFDALKSSVDGADFAKYPVDVWIAKDSELFTQVGFKTQSGEAIVDVTLTFKDYNKEVTVEEPANAEPIINVLTTFYQTLYGASLDSDVPDNLLQ